VSSPCKIDRLSQESSKKSFWASAASNNFSGRFSTLLARVCLILCQGRPWQHLAKDLFHAAAQNHLRGPFSGLDWVSRIFWELTKSCKWLRRGVGDFQLPIFSICYRPSLAVVVCRQLFNGLTLVSYLPSASSHFPFASSCVCPQSCLANVC